MMKRRSAAFLAASLIGMCFGQSVCVAGGTRIWELAGYEELNQGEMDGTVVSSDGEVKIETRGFKGRSCIQEAQFLKDLLGDEVERMPTPAYFQSEEAVVKRYLSLCG